MVLDAIAEFDRLGRDVLALITNRVGSAVDIR